MDFPAWELLTELSNHGNLAAKFFLTNWDSIFVENEGHNTSNEANSFIFDTKSLIKTLYTQLSSGNNDLPPASRNWEYWSDRDFRIKDLVISGYRGIPYEKEPAGNKTSNGEDNQIKYYGLSVTDKKSYSPEEANDNIPASYVILGSNGSGKTSLYSALELLLLEKTSIESKHKINTAESQNKFRHFLGDTNNPLYIAATLVDPDVIPQYTSSNNTLSLKNKSIKENVDLSPFFCSESDLAIIECSGKDVNTYLDETIGLGEINRIISRTNDIINTTEQIIEGISQNTEISENERSTRIDQYGKIIKLIKEIKDRAENKNENIKNDILLQAQSIISDLLKDYEDEQVELSYSIKGNIKLFNGKLQLKSSQTQIDPRYYFNNFRFKLYLVSLKVAIAFYIMKSRKISFPLIFDDIFDSSDFTNRVYSKDYFNKIFKAYHKHKILKDKPLQIIFFTQDEVIAESIFDGICDLRKDKSNNTDREEYYPERDIKLVRLFTPSESDKDDKFYISTNGKNGYPEYAFNLYDMIRQSTFTHR